MRELCLSIVAVERCRRDSRAVAVGSYSEKLHPVKIRLGFFFLFRFFFHFFVLSLELNLLFLRKTKVCSLKSFFFRFFCPR